MRILVISSTPWSEQNSFGSTFSNFFQGMEKVEIANVFCKSGLPQNNLVSRYFQITFMDLIRNLKNSSHPSGKELQCQAASTLTQNVQKRYDTARKLRWQIFFWANDLIWSVGRWRSEALDSFLEDFQPDVIFQPLYYSKHLNQIALYCKEKTGAPMVGYVSDDIYTLRQFSLSPLYWIDRLWVRGYVKKGIDACEWIYTISRIQKEEYEKIFKKEFKILTKGADFSGQPSVKEKLSDPVRFVYTGNIGGGRWKSLALLATAIQKKNHAGQRAILDIYTPTPLTNRMKKKLCIAGASRVLGSVPSDRIPAIQQGADVLVHAEGMGLRSRLEVHQSFSTKLVDYFRAGRCVFAIGTPDMASIDHLCRYKAAIVATSAAEVEANLERVLSDRKLYCDTVSSAWECGKRCHNKQELQKMLYEDLDRLRKDT